MCWVKCGLLFPALIGEGALLMSSKSERSMRLAMQMVTERQRGESNNPAIGAASDMYMPPSYDDVKSNGGSQQISGTPGSKSQKALYFLAEVQFNHLLLTELVCLLNERFRPSRVSYHGILSFFEELHQVTF